MRALFVASLFTALSAHAQWSGNPVDLDRPGALAALQKERPDHYQAVIDQVRHAERMSCTFTTGSLRAGEPAEHERCRSYFIGTSYPAKAHLSIPVDGVRYIITAYVDVSLDRMVPAR